MMERNKQFKIYHKDTYYTMKSSRSNTTNSSLKRLKRTESQTKPTE